MNMTPEQIKKIADSQFEYVSGYGYMLNVDDLIEFAKALSQPNEPVALLALKNTQLQNRIDVLEDLLTSAHNIANRNGTDTHWLRFAGQLYVHGIGCLTAKTFKILPSDDEYSAPPNLEEENKLLEAKVKELEIRNQTQLDLIIKQDNERAELTAKVKELELQLKDRESDLAFEFKRANESEGTALIASQKYVDYCDLSETKIAELTAKCENTRAALYLAHNHLKLYGYYHANQTIYDACEKALEELSK